MHVLTLVIVPGSRGTAYRRANRLVDRVGSRGVDYWSPGGRYEDRLPELGLTSLADPWPMAIPATYLPSPLPESLVPFVLVTPRGAWLWSPVEDTTEARSAWSQRLNRIIDKYRGGHTVVLMDVHF